MPACILAFVLRPDSGFVLTTFFGPWKSSKLDASTT